MCLSNTLFPVPERPMTTVVLPRSTRRSTSSSTRCRPNALLRRRSSMIGAASGTGAPRVVHVAMTGFSPLEFTFASRHGGFEVFTSQRAARHVHGLAIMWLSFQPLVLRAQRHRQRTMSQQRGTAFARTPFFKIVERCPNDRFCLRVALLVVPQRANAHAHLH